MREFNLSHTPNPLDMNRMNQTLRTCSSMRLCCCCNLSVGVALNVHGEQHPYMWHEQAII